jgi:hypothetical protein
VKINQYCSVCKKHLDMEVIPTDDGGDDGVIWLRCPECQGFLPKFTGEGLATDTTDRTDDAAAADAATTATLPAATGTSDPAAAPAGGGDQVDQQGATTTGHEVDATDSADAADAAGPADDDAADEPATASEPIAEYAAQLAAADPEQARPYRPSSTYEVGDVVHHLAYGDIGIVVAKKTLPGGRLAVKVYFEEAGVVHLIEQAADGH